LAKDKDMSKKLNKMKEESEATQAELGKIGTE